MIVVDKISDIQGANFKAVALGNFDGVHKGHFTLIDALVQKAREQNGVAIVLSFYPHPLEVLQHKLPPILTEQADKESLMAAHGVDYFVRFPFDLNVAGMLPEKFVYDILIGQLHANHIFVGFNYTFGAKAKGNAEMLKEICAKEGVGVTVMPPLLGECGAMSSTLIRKTLSEGDVTSAAQMLGYAFFLRGEVVHGNHIGGPQLNFPTANLSYDVNAQLPQKGVYWGYFEWDRGQICPCVINVGSRPTVGDNLAVTIESHLLDFDGDLYGKQGIVHFLGRIRGEQKFSSFEELKQQIQKDVENARAYFARGCNIVLFTQITCK